MSILDEVVRECYGTKPQAVRMFAPGYWAEVHEHKTLQERVHEYRQRAHGEREVDLAPAAMDIPDFLGAA